MKKYQITQLDVERVNKAMAFIEKNYTVHYTHEQLAHFVGTNEERLKTTFKAITGKSLYKYLVNYRVEKGKEMLEYTFCSTEVIARKLGWDKSNFFKAFKKITKFTPVAWRRSIRKRQRGTKNQPDNGHSKNSGIATFRVLHCVGNSETCSLRCNAGSGKINVEHSPIINYKVKILPLDNCSLVFNRVGLINRNCT